ncbi:MAG: hypothetical protein KIS67_18640 [Verrucomicrobiae bacterium]|nr:hypothetical protein [Verrucomicrobiae bacterium]
MKSRIVADGATRLSRSAEYQMHLSELREFVRARHARELAEAGFVRRLVLHWRIAAEYRRERRKVLPSAQSLYSSQTLTAKD